jgi:hypothetical protein
MADGVHSCSESSPGPLSSHADAASLQACSDVCALRWAQHDVAPLQTKHNKLIGAGMAQVSAVQVCCVLSGGHCLI